jgi:cytochrome c biogenesis protein
VLNVENFGDNGASASGADVRKVDLRESIESRLGAGNKTVAKRELRNVGPSVSYKLRDAAGQAREFNNFMLPVDTGDGQAVFLLGVRETQADPMRYLRVPVDAEGRMDGFVRLRLALADPALREKAVRRYAAAAVDAKRPELAEQLAQSAARALALFAGDTLGDGTMEKLAAVNGRPLAGLPAISEFMEANVPEGERERAAEVLMRIMNGALFELAQITREQAGLAPLEPGEKTQAFMTQAVLSLSDSQAYPAPMVFELTDFKQIQASVFEVARAPGKNVVYLGCALLIIGIFAMLYVRDRRLWVWLAPGSGGAQATMALSANRKTLDTDREFAQLRTQLLGTDETLPHGGKT